MAFRSPLLMSRYLILPTASAGLLLSFQRPSLFTTSSPYTKLRQSPLRCDSPATAFSGQTRTRNRGGLNADVIRQISGGGLVGTYLIMNFLEDRRRKG
jgi:hypothetical protein